MQGFSGCDEAKSSMHSEKVPGDEMTHLDEEVANSNRMNCGGFRLSAQRCHSNKDAAHAPLPTRAKLCLQPCAPVLRHHHICIASTFAAVTPLCKSMVNPPHLM